MPTLRINNTGAVASRILRVSKVTAWPWEDGLTIVHFLSLTSVQVPASAITLDQGGESGDF